MYSGIPLFVRDFFIIIAENYGVMFLYAFVVKSVSQVAMGDGYGEGILRIVIFRLTAGE